MGIIFITILDVVLQCVGWRVCEQYSFVSFRQLLSSGMLELMIEIPVVLGAKTVIAKLKVYRRKEGNYIEERHC